jgi:hypothetical protein
MTTEIVFVVAAVGVAIAALSLSPLVRAICWDAVVHPKFHCHWAKDGDRLREIKMPQEREK